MTAASRGTWRELGRRLHRHATEERLLVVAAGVAFYGLLASLPTVVAVVTGIGLAFGPERTEGEVVSLGQLVPPGASDLVERTLREISEVDTRTLGWGAVGTALVVLWSSSAGVRALMRALNLAYGVEERRTLRRRFAVSLALALAAIVGGLVALAGILLLPALVGGLDDASLGPLSWARWPIVAIVFWIALRVLYRYAPSRPHAEWSWWNTGAAVAVALWLAGSALFSWYVAHFGSYNRLYGSMGAVVILLLWYLLSAWAVLLGAEIDGVEAEEEATAAPPRTR